MLKINVYLAWRNQAHLLRECFPETWRNIGLKRIEVLQPRTSKIRLLMILQASTKSLTGLYLSLWSTVSRVAQSHESWTDLTFNCFTRSSRRATRLSISAPLCWAVLPRGRRARWTILHLNPAFLHAKQGTCLSHFVLRRLHCSQLKRNVGDGFIVWVK